MILGAPHWNHCSALSGRVVSERMWYSGHAWWGSQSFDYHDLPLGRFLWPATRADKMSDEGIRKKSCQSISFMAPLWKSATWVQILMDRIWWTGFGQSCYYLQRLSKQDVGPLWPFSLGSSCISHPRFNRKGKSTTYSTYIPLWRTHSTIVPSYIHRVISELAGLTELRLLGMVPKCSTDMTR